MTRMLFGGFPSRTLCVSAAGTVHRVERENLREWTNRHGATFTEWRADCGATGTVSGHVSAGTATGITSIDGAHRAMLCRRCCP